LDGERLALPLDEVERVAADGAGASQHGHAARGAPLGGRGHRQAMTPPPPQRLRAATAGSTASKPSSRSRTPPWPGMRPLESLTPKYRFAIDSARSPACATTARSPATIGFHGSIGAPIAAATATPAIMAATTPPKRPDQVLLGLMRGARRGPPKVRPTA